MTHEVPFPNRTLWGAKPRPSEDDFAQEIGSGRTIGDYLGQASWIGLTETRWSDGLIAEYAHYGEPLEKSPMALAAIRVLLPAAIGEVSHNLACLQRRLCALKMAHARLQQIDTESTTVAKADPYEQAGYEDHRLVIATPSVPSALEDAKRALLAAVREPNMWQTLAKAAERYVEAAESAVVTAEKRGYDRGIEDCQLAAEVAAPDQEAAAEHRGYERGRAEALPIAADSTESCGCVMGVRYVCVRHCGGHGIPSPQKVEPSDLLQLPCDKDGHRFPEGIYGAPCSVCGWRFGEADRRRLGLVRLDAIVRLVEQGSGLAQDLADEQEMVRRLNAACLQLRERCEAAQTALKRRVGESAQPSIVCSAESSLGRCELAEGHEGKHCVTISFGDEVAER